MLIEKVRSSGLAHLSYIVGSGTEAAIIDPRRDCDVYIELAEQNGMKISYILETHRNEDYVTGSMELEQATGARILHGDLPFRYGERIVDEEEIRLENVILRAISTPGHTPESMSYVLIDLSSGNEPVAIFTGDTLFVGEVGRTDLFGRENIAKAASEMHRSIFEKLLPLGNGALIFPAHGAGSSCGANIGQREISTIGLEAVQNPALRMTDREDFIALKMREKIERPWYFGDMERINLEGQPVLGHLPGPPSLSPREFKGMMDAGALVVDVRSPSAFASAHIKGSLSLYLDILPNYAGWVLPYDRPILLLLESPRDQDAAVRYLVREGYDSIAGSLSGGIESWYDHPYDIGRLEVAPSADLERMVASRDMLVLDIRSEKEWEGARIKGSEHIFVGHLDSRYEEVPEDRDVAVMCSSGIRGSLASSVLMRHGRTRIMNVLGGMKAWNNLESGPKKDRGFQ